MSRHVDHISYYKSSQKRPSQSIKQALDMNSAGARVGMMFCSLFHAMRPNTLFNEPSFTFILFFTFDECLFHPFKACLITVLDTK